MISKPSTRTAAAATVPRRSSTRLWAVVWAGPYSPRLRPSAVSARQKSPENTQKHPKTPKTPSLLRSRTGDDPARPGLHRRFDHREPDGAQAEHGHGGAGFHLGGVENGAPASGDAAAEQADLR